MLVFIRLSRFFTGQNFVSDQFNVTQPSKIVLNRTSCFQTIRCNGIVCCRWTPGHNHPQGAVASSHQFVREYCEERHSCNPVNWPTKHDARSYQLPLRNAAWNLWGFLWGFKSQRACNEVLMKDSTNKAWYIYCEWTADKILNSFMTFLEPRRDNKMRWSNCSTLEDKQPKKTITDDIWGL